MIDFQPFPLMDKSIYQQYLFAEKERGCELSYANLNMWGNHTATILHNHVLLLCCYSGRYMYPFPIGSGDKKPVLDRILSDAKQRNIPCVISSLNKETAALLEELYPGKFEFHFNRNSFDYVYDIEKLSSLGGRKYHRKRNHYNRFCKNIPDYTIKPLDAAILPEVKTFLDSWYHDRLQESPDNDYAKEKEALERALINYEKWGLESLVLSHRGQILAVTFGSQLSFNTFDIHFEKARWDVEGAYAAINCEFAKYLKEKYKEVQFLNREEDMGLEGLRKAKESYFPHHMVEKGFAILKENTHENS